MPHVAWVPVLAAIPLAVLARLLSIAIPILCFGGKWPNQLRQVTVLTWAGMRGGVSIAMVLATPDSPWSSELLTICLAVVLFTVFVQGLTLPWALRRLYREEVGARLTAGMAGSLGWLIVRASAGAVARR